MVENQQKRCASEETNEEPRTLASRKCLLILGMHRSGTSALTGTLGILGATLPNDLLGSHPSNAKGHFESSRVLELNEQILTALNTYWYDVGPIDFSSADSISLDRLRIELITTLQTAYNKTPLFALKDPRISRLLPLIFSVLKKFGASARIIVCLRNPLEVAKSLEARDGIALSHGFALWLRYMLEAELHSRGVPRVFVHFSDLLQDWRSIVREIEQRLGVALPGRETSAADTVSEFLDKSLRHQLAAEPEENVREHRSAWTCYRTLIELVHNPDDSHIEHQLDQIRISLDQSPEWFSQVINKYYGEIREIRPRLSAAEKKVEELETLNKQNTLELRDLRDGTRALGEQIESLERQVGSFRQQDKLIRRKMLRLEGKNQKLKQQKRDILDSWSWRLTAPLRKIISWVAVFGFSRGR
jgi:hypothetical protein